MKRPMQFLRAMDHLEKALGAVVCRAVDPRRCEEIAGGWVLRAKDGRDVARIENGGDTILSPLIGDGVAHGRVQSVRVVCDGCSHPRVLIGAETGENSYLCRSCKRRIFWEMPR